MKIWKFFLFSYFIFSFGYSQNNQSSDILTSDSEIGKKIDPARDPFCEGFDLKTLTLKDLGFIEKTLIENHPGTCNLEDPDFVKWVKSGYEIALNQVKSLKSEDDYIYILHTYASGFHDGHLWIKFFNQKKEREINQKPSIFMGEGPVSESIWITLSSFDIEVAQKKQLEEIISNLPSFRSKKLLIFDLRGNSGGNSEWGNRIVSALFTEAYATEKLHQVHKNVSVDWRISTGNIEHVKNLTKTLKETFGESSEVYQEVCKTYQGMLSARMKDACYYHENSSERLPSKIDVQNPVKANIIVIIDRKCGSSCLTFIDSIKAMKQTTLLVGETTAADSLYMEIRHLKLPSGLAEIWFPIKVYRNRQRGHNEPYSPDIKYPGDLQDTANLKKWIQFLNQKTLLNICKTL